MYFFPWKLLPMQRSNLKEITTFYTQSPLLSLTSKTSPNSAVKLCRTHAVRCHSASLEVWAGLGDDWSVHEHPISWLPFLADWRQNNPIPSKGSFPKWALLLCHPAPDLSWGEDGVPRQTGRKPVWMERKPRHLSKCNVSAKQRWRDNASSSWGRFPILVQGKRLIGAAGEVRLPLSSTTAPGVQVLALKCCLSGAYPAGRINKEGLLVWRNAAQPEVCVRIYLWLKRFMRFSPLLLSQGFVITIPASVLSNEFTLM